MGNNLARKYWQQFFLSRAKEGLLLLEARPDRSRLDLVDPDTLNMRISESCVVAQFFGGWYLEGLRQLDCDTSFATQEAYGFNVQVVTVAAIMRDLGVSEDDAYTWAYETLTDAWKEVLHARS